MTNRICNDPETKQLISERESALLGHVRKLREVLFEQLRRPSTAARERAFEVLELTRGEFASCPDDQPSLWLDPHTISQCAGFLEDIALERENPSYGDPDAPIPEFVHGATLRYAAKLMLQELPDVTGTRPEAETLASSRRAFDYFSKALDRYSKEIDRLDVVERSRRDADDWEPAHLFDKAAMREDGRDKYDPWPGTVPALCQEQCGNAEDEWVDDGTCLERRLCARCIDCAVELDRAPARPILDPNHEFEWELDEGASISAPTPAGKYSVLCPGARVVFDDAVVVPRYYAAFNGKLIGEASSRDAARDLCHEHYAKLAAEANGGAK